jgi:hypothetical protein
VPAAAAASAVLAFSSHVSDHPQRRSSDGAARVAAVRPAASSAAELVLPAPSGAPKGGGTARDDKRGQHTTRPRPQGSESGTPGDATLPAAVASSASTTPTTSAPTPTAGRLATAVRDVVGAVQGATPSVAGSVRAPRLAPVVKSVTAAVKSVRTTTTAVTAGTTPTIPAVTAEVAETASVVSATVAGLIEPFSASAP